MSDPKQAQALLEAAEKDVSALRGMGDTTVFADEIFGFHVQQAAEKLFKAWLSLLGEVYPMTHDLTELLELLKARRSDAGRFDPLADFSPYAVQFRYGMGDAGAEALDRDRVLGQVEPLLEEVRMQSKETGSAARRPTRN